MNAERKTHSNSILRNLPAEKQAAIIAHIDGEGSSYVETAEWLRKDGIPATPELVSRFRQRYLLMEELWESEDFALEMTALCKERGWVKTARSERAAAQMFFNRSVLKKGDPKVWSMVERVNLLKDRAQLEEKKVKLAERKYKDKKAKGKETEKEDGTGLTPEEKEAAIRHIYGMS